MKKDSIKSTKIRRNYENYQDNYWETTFELTAIHDKKFRGSLELIRNFIRDNKKELECDLTTSEFRIFYKKLQILLRVKFPTEGQIKTTVEKFTKKINAKDKNSENELVSPRKIINGFVKLGFIQSHLSSYHYDVDAFLNAKTIRKRQSIFSKIVYENSSFRSSTTKPNPSGHLEFLIKTLEEVGKLCDDDIKGLMVTEITNFSNGYLIENELKSRIKFSKKPDPKDGTLFATDRILTNEEIKIAHQKGWKIKTNKNGNTIIKSRKYNQFNFLKTFILKNLDGIILKNNCFYFEEDAKKLFPEIPKGRDNYLHGIYRNMLENETIEKLNERQCMVEGIAYPVLIASHVKRWDICNKEFVSNHNDIKKHEGYDSDNGLYLSQSLDGLFDKGWITFDNNGKIIFSENVSKSVKEKYKNAKINSVFLNHKRKEYLKWNREHWFKGNK